MIKDLDFQLPLFNRYLRFGLRFKADKADPGLSGLFIEQFLLSIGAHVPIEDDYLGLGADLFYFQGIGYGSGTADPAAIGVRFLPGTHTLDHDHLFDLGDLFRFLAQPLVKFQLGLKPGIPTVGEFLRLILAAAGSDHYRAKFQHIFFALLFYRTFELPDVSLDIQQIGLGQDADLGVRFYLAINCFRYSFTSNPSSVKARRRAWPPSRSLFSTK